MKILFVCTYNLTRSPTAERIFGDSFETRSKGLARNVVERQDIDWADVVVVMEDFMRVELEHRFGNFPVKVLGVGPDFRLMQPELVLALRESMLRVGLAPLADGD